MTVSVKIKSVRNQRGRYLFQTRERLQLTEETNAQVRRVAVEMAKYLAGQMAKQDKHREA
ncbi:hypothetical protein A9D60_24795 [Leisingera sp. JC1]|nr:hypothetical protein A9D60_24795 [Leisingera sp. JC1]